MTQVTSRAYPELVDFAHLHVNRPVASPVGQLHLAPVRFDQAGAGVSMQNKSDSQMDRQMNARDAVYYSYIKDHQFQFPLAHIYNHDPVYGKSGTA